MYTPLLGTGPDILEPVAEFYKSQPEGNLGPFYVSALSDFFFLGIFFQQLWYYYSCYQKDQVWIRRLVAVVTTLSIYKAIPSFYTVWDKNIVNFGEWINSASVSWPIYTEVSASTIINITAQMFFAWRCFTLTGRNWYLLGFLGTAMLVVLGFSGAVSFFYAVDPFNHTPLLKFGMPMIACGFIIDAVITVTVSHKLIQHRGVLTRSTDGLLNQLLSITWEAAMPPLLSQALNIILCATMAHDNNWHLVFNMMTPRLYVFSLMYTLNSRKDVRQAGSAPTGNQDEQIALSSFKPRNRHELSSTQITTNHSFPEIKTGTQVNVSPRASHDQPSGNKEEANSVNARIHYHDLCEARPIPQGATVNYKEQSDLRDGL